MAGSFDKTSNSNAGREKGWTPLACAAEAGDIDTISELLTHGFEIDIDVRDYDGRTSLALAAQEGHTAVVERLLAHGANPNLRDLDQVAPLWQAAQYGHASVVRLLLASTQLSDVNPRPTFLHKHKSDTPLSIALKNGHQETAELLAHADGINPCLKTTRYDDYSWTLLSMLGFAIHDGFEDVALALLDKCDLGHNFEGVSSGDETNDDKVTKDTIEPLSKLLVLAAGAGCSRIVRDLLTKHGADVNAVHGYYAGEGIGWVKHSPLMAASRRGDLNAVLSFLEMDEIRPGVGSKHSGTALTQAAKGGSVDVVKVLIADGRIDVDCKDYSDRTALSYAAESASEAMVAELLATGATDPDSRDNLERTPLIWAAIHGSRYGSGSWKSYKGVICRLLANCQVDVNAKDREGCTALCYASKNGALGLVMVLLDHPGIDPTAGSKVTSPLAGAATSGHADVVQALLNTGRVDVNTANGVFGRTALMSVARHGRIEDESAAQVLLSSDDIDVNLRDIDGWTALMVAARRGTAGIVKLILTSGGDPNIQTDNGTTALSLTSDFEVTRTLLGAPGIKPDLPNNVGRTALSLAAEAGEIGRVGVFLASDGVNPDARDILGRGPLSWVFGRNGLRDTSDKEDRKAVLQQLLQFPAVDPNSEDHNGLTPLLLAIMSDDGHEYVKVLLSRPDLDVNRPPVGGRDSPLDTAKQISNMDTVALLVERGAVESVSSVRSQRFDPVFMAEGGLLPSAYSEFGRTPPEKQMERRARPSSHEPNFDRGRRMSLILLGRVREHLREYHLHLGEQQAYVDKLAESTASMCSSCSAINLGSAFSRRHTQYRGRVIADLGRVDETWKKRNCPLCRLFATVYPHTSRGEGHKLVSFSTTQSWLCHESMSRWKDFQFKRFLDTMLLAVVAADTLVADVSPSRCAKAAVESAFSCGLIGRLGSDGLDQCSVTIPRLAAEISDWGIPRDWITLCRESHPQECNPLRTATVPHLFLIDCSTRQIIEQKQSQAGPQPQYVALSYVWRQSPNGQQPPQRRWQQQESLDKEGGGVVEAAIEDAIRVTLELGYRYLWVDRYCIVQTGNEAIKQEQLRHMHLVYANAEVTLIAAAGKDASAGLPGAPGRPRSQQPGALVQDHALVCIPPDPSLHVRSCSTWATRGWTYQEGLLARRRLYFSEHEMSYECRHMLCREALRLPVGLEQRISGYKPRFMEPFWMYEPYRLPGMDSSHTGVGLFDLLAVYSTRQLSLPSDTLNAMLGILSLLAQHETKPIYHVCGVPILRLTHSEQSNDDTDITAAVSLCGFLDGLCWRLQEPGQRRDGFPSWSWTGWQGVVAGMNKDKNPIKQTYGFAIDVSIIPGNPGGGITVPWSSCYDQLRMADDSKSDIRSGQHHVLEITASVVTVNFRRGEYEGRPNTWIGTVCVGHDVWQGEFLLTRKDVGDHDNLLLPPLLRKPWTGIVLGNSQSQEYKNLRDTNVLVIQEHDHKQQQGDVQDRTYCERIGLLTLVHCTLDGSMLEQRTWRLS